MYEFVKDCKDAVKEVAPVIVLVALMLIAIFSLVFLVDKSKEEENKPTPKTTTTVAVATPEPTPTPTPEPTLSPEELDKLIAEEEARWRQEALEYAAENLPQTYKELVYEYYLLLEACDDLVCDNENLESMVYDLEEKVMDLEDDLDYQKRY